MNIVDSRVEGDGGLRLQQEGTKKSGFGTKKNGGQSGRTSVERAIFQPGMKQERLGNQGGGGGGGKEKERSRITFKKPPPPWMVVWGGKKGTWQLEKKEGGLQFTRRTFLRGEFVTCREGFVKNVLVKKNSVHGGGVAPSHKKGRR